MPKPHLFFTSVIRPRRVGLMVCLVAVAVLAAFHLPTRPISAAQNPPPDFGRWVQTSGPEGGPVESLVTDGASVFAATRGGLYVSTDNGQSWTPNPGLADAFVRSLAFDGTYLFAGTLKGVFRSSDRGQTWSLSNNGLDVEIFRVNGLQTVCPLAVVGSAVFIGTPISLFRSLNQGSSWESVRLDPRGGNVRKLAVSGQRVFALHLGSSSEAYLSTDGGQSWTLAAAGLPAVALVIQDLAMLGESAYAVVAESTGPLPNPGLVRVFRFDFGSRSWTPHNSGLTSTPDVSEIGYPPRFVTAGNQLYLQKGRRLFLLSSDGSNWSALNLNLPPLKSALKIGETALLFGTTDGAFRSTDGGQTWQAASRGIIATATAPLGTNGQTIWAAAAYVDSPLEAQRPVFRSTDKGQSWAAASGLPAGGGGLSNFVVAGAKVFVGTSQGLFISTDDGQSWATANPNFKKSIRALAAGGGKLFAVVEEVELFGLVATSVYSSADEGQNWSKGVGDLPAAMSCLALDGSKVFAGGFGLSRSTDGGLTWEGLDNRFAQVPTIYSLVVSGTTLLAGTNSGIFRSTDDGRSWTNISPPSYRSGVWRVVVRGANIFFTSTTDLYASTDGGQNWIRYDDRLSNFITADLAISGNDLLAGTERGVFINRGLAAATPFAGISAASYATSGPLAAASIVSGFGTNLAATTEVAASLPLPTELGGVTVRVRDSAGVERLAPLFFVSPLQVNYLLPEGLAAGAATVTLVNADQSIALGTVQVAAVAPGLFTFTQDGRGFPAAYTERYRNGQNLGAELVAARDAQGNWAARPIDLGAEGDQVFLTLFGTGVRGRSSLAGVTAQVGGVSVPVEYAGAQGGYAGLDQVNLRLPRSLAGRGEVIVSLTVDGRQANAVKVSFR
jgi:uncharacterized protein (TIGR03437 family)